MFNSFDRSVENRMEYNEQNREEFDLEKDELDLSGGFDDDSFDEIDESEGFESGINLDIGYDE